MDPGVEAQQLYEKKYGRAPAARKGPLGRLSGKERKFFDSADHALSSAGVKTETGKVIATTQNIPRPTHTKPTSMTDHTQDIISKDEEDTQTDTTNPESDKMIAE